MYFVTNYGWFWRYPETFTNYKQAKEVYDGLGDNTNIIEFFDMMKHKRKVVYPKQRRG